MDETSAEVSSYPIPISILTSAEVNMEIRTGYEASTDMEH